MKLTLQPLGGLQSEDLARWRELAGSAIEPNPFFEPDYLLPLARGLGALQEVSLAVVDDRGSWLACMPVRRTARWHRIPLPALAAWRGRGLLPALIGTPLISGGHVHEATAALVAQIARCPGTRFAAFDGLVEDGPVFEALQSAIGEQGLWSLPFGRERRAFLHRRADGELPGHTISKKHMRNLRSQQRRLAAEMGSDLEIVDRAGDPDAVAELVALEGRSRLAARGSVLSSDPAQATFFADMCSTFAARGRLQLLALQAGSRTLAMKCSLLADPGAFYLKIAYEEAYARFSPGIQLEVAALAMLGERRSTAWIDSCAFPNNDTFNRLLPQRRSLITLTIADRRIGTLAAAPIIRAARQLRDRAMQRGI